MAPRFSIPAPKTESAREAARTFFCELCNKGYSRMPEYETHLSSYEHTHAQRRKEAKQFLKNPLNQDVAEEKRKKEERDMKKAGITAVKVEVKPGSGAGFKKGGFKSAGFKKIGAKPEEKVEKAKVEEVKIPGLSLPGPGATKSGLDDEIPEGHDQSNDFSFWCAEDPGYEYYDPLRPYGCGDDCACKMEKNDQCGPSCDLCRTLPSTPG